MPNSTIVGYVQHYDKRQMWNWAHSLKAHYTGNVVVIASDISQETYEWITKTMGFTCYTHMAHSTAAVVTRFLYMWKLIEMGKIKTDWVMMSDVKDVVFQDDLAKFYDNQIGNDWVAGGENVRYEDEPWGRDNLAQSFPHEYEGLKDYEIINAGTFSAYHRIMMEICRFVYHMSVGNRVHNPDQAALNVFLRHSAIEPMGRVYSIRDRYAIQCGTVLDPTKNLTQMNASNPIVQDDGTVLSPFGTPYYIVHQYDRHNQLKQIIDQRYSAKS